MKHRLSILLSALAMSATAFATQPTLHDLQIASEIQSNKIIFMDGQPAGDEKSSQIDSLREVISAFYYDQFRHFQDPGAPYFLFMSKDAQLAMGLGGSIRMRGYYDWGGAMPSNAFAPYMIPMTPDLTNMKHFDTTPSGTCLFFRVIGRNKQLGQYQLYIEANFTGYNNRDFKLKKAYAIINDFTVGYAPSTFSDPAAQSPIVDAQGANNKITPTSVLVRYMPVVRNKWYFAVSAETPSSAISADGVSAKKSSNWLPDFAAFAQYQWAPGQHVRLAGIVRTLSYRDLLNNTNHTIAGTGFQLSAVGNPLPALTAYGTLNYGRGIASLGGDLNIGNYDLVSDPNVPGRLYAPHQFGWMIGLKYNFRPNLFVSVTASESRYLPGKPVAAEEFKYGLFGAANIFWNITPRIQVAAEYDLGSRRNFSGAHRNAQRVNAMCQFSF